MRILIAGWHGQIARAIAHLAPSETEITALAMGRPALDLCHPPSIRRALLESSPDIVINTAAYTDVERAESEPKKVFELNRDGAEAFAELTAKSNIPIIHLSTDYIFDGRKGSPYVEDDPPAPLNIYGQSKLESERAVTANPQHIVLRTAWVYSPSNRNFVKSMLKLAEAQQEIEVVNDQWGSPTYAHHLAELIIKIAVRIKNSEKPVPWGLYNAAGKGGTSWFGFAEKIFSYSEQFGGPHALVVPVESSKFPRVAARPRDSRLDCSRLEAEFGQQLPEWTKGVEACVREIVS